jgi:hypothetical protein
MKKTLLYALGLTASTLHSQTAPNFGTCDKAPKVFTAVVQLNDLVSSDANISQWKYVQNNLDGIWFNGAGTSRDNTEKVLKLIQPDFAILIASINSHKPMVVSNRSLDIRVSQMRDWLPNATILGSCLVNQGDDTQKDWFVGDAAEGKPLIVPKYGPESYTDPKGGYFNDPNYGDSSNVLFDMIKNSDGLMFELGFAKFVHQDISVVPLATRQKIWRRYITECRTHTPRFYSVDPRWTSGLLDSYLWMRDNNLLPDIFALIEYGTDDNAITDISTVEPDMYREFDDSKGTYNKSYTGALYAILDQIHKDFGCYEDARKYYGPVWEFVEKGNSQGWVTNTETSSAVDLGNFKK